MELAVGLDPILKGIAKMTRILENFSEPEFSSEEYMMFYNIIYTLCSQKPNNYTQQVYDKYREILEEYIHSTVLVSLKEKHEEVLLQEFVSRWKNHKVMVEWMSRFFRYLDRFYIPRWSLPCLKDVGISCFRDLVFEEAKVEVHAAVTALSKRLSHQEREGEQVERALLENVQNVIVEIVQTDRAPPLSKKFQNINLEN